MVKKIIICISLIFWMGLIFFFSNQPDVESDKMSNGVIERLINVVEKLGNHEFSDSELDLIYKYAVFPIRKLAHLTLYFILGILVYNFIILYRAKDKKMCWLSTLICVLYACSDEIHQLFIPGRAGSIKDVFIDTIGSLLGIFLCYKLFKRKVDRGKTID